MGRIALLAGLGFSLALASAASAAVTVTTFDNFTTGSRYGTFGSSAATTFTSGPTSFRVQSVNGGFGGFFKDLPALSVNGSAENAIEFDVTVSSTTSGLAFLAVLGDTDFTEAAYRFYAPTAGTYVVTLPLSPIPNTVTGVGDSFYSSEGGTPGLFKEDIDFIHVQVDSGGAYDLSFNNLRLVTIPEPTSLAALGAAGTLLGRRRRR